MAVRQQTEELVRAGPPVTGRLRACLRLLTGQRGSILLETAFILPVLMPLMMGVIEMGRFLLIEKKVTQLASSAGDLTARAEVITEEDINQIFSAAQYVVRPFTMGNRGIVIISSVSAAAGANPTINWQRSGAGQAAIPSAIGSAGGDALLPNGFVVRDGQNIIVAEAYLNYEPLFFSNFVEARLMTDIAIMRPRFGELTAIE